MSGKNESEFITQGLKLRNTLGGNNFRVTRIAWSPSGNTLAVPYADGTIQVWNTETAERRCVHKAQPGWVYSVAWSPDGRILAFSSSDYVVWLWNIETQEFSQPLRGHSEPVNSLAWSPDGRLLASASDSNDILIWNTRTGRINRKLQKHFDAVNCVAWSPNGQTLASASDDGTIILWAVPSYKPRCELVEHFEGVTSVAWSPDGERLVSGSHDKTILLWNPDSGKLVSAIEGHTDSVKSVSFSYDGNLLASKSDDGTVMIWHAGTWKVIAIIPEQAYVYCPSSLSFHPKEPVLATSGEEDSNVRIWDIDIDALLEAVPVIDSVHYTNAKVVLVGDSGAGKTGLSMRLALDDWEPSDSTVGAWATHWKLPVSSAEGVEREIWLWDFGGQADQRLIHQLYMEDTALAVLIFDGQKEDLFESLGQWNRDISRASSKAFTKLLAAGRVDAGGLRAASRGQVEVFVKERGFEGFLETSAKTGAGCEELKQAILQGIQWEEIPWRSSPLLFKRLKEEIIRLKDGGRVLMRFNELRDTLRLQMASGGEQFKDEELKAVLRLLAGPGVVWELAFGSWVLLQPELINAYAQAVIQTLRAEPHERGCIAEEWVLNGDLTYHSSMRRLETEEERIVLLAMHQMLVERGLCLREHTDKGPQLIFPSYYRRERPELVGHPAALVSYRFNGFLDDIYATLVVRLHHTKPFQQDELWRYAADFKTLTGKQLGVKLTRLAEGTGELEVYFDPFIPIEEKIIFSQYVHEHLLKKAQDVERFRYYVCPHCGTPVGNREVAMKKLADGYKDIPCINCDDSVKRIPLWDQMEELFASPETKQRVWELQEQSDIVLDNESKNRVLVGEVISTVAQAGHISREVTVSDYGIDMEIEFKDDAGEATGQKLYLQLKSGDSYLRKRKRDDAEVFTIKDERHAHYWMAQAFPVLLVIRTSEGEIRWMEVRDWLKCASDNGKQSVKQIPFEGQRFDVMSVRRWGDKVLREDLP